MIVLFIGTKEIYLSLIQNVPSENDSIEEVQQDWEDSIKHRQSTVFLCKKGIEKVKTYGVLQTELSPILVRIISCL